MDETIFRSYDIRGIYGKTIDEGIMKQIGRTFAEFCGMEAIVGMDARASSPQLKKAFCSGLNSGGANATDIGIVNKGVAMFAGWRTGQKVAYVSASHLPGEWNGVKFAHESGRGFSPEENAEFKEKFLELLDKENKDGEFKEKVAKGNVASKTSPSDDNSSGDNLAGDRSSVNKNGKSPKGDNSPLKRGRTAYHDFKEEYIKYLADYFSKYTKTGKRVLIDCGNGTAAMTCEEIFRRLKIKTGWLFKEPKAKTGRQSEVKEEFLEAAKKEATKYDVTIAYDGDADRFNVIDDKGRALNAERIAYILLKEMESGKGKSTSAEKRLHKDGGFPKGDDAKSPDGDKSSAPARIVTTVDVSKMIDDICEERGMELYRSAVGYTNVMGLMAEKGAVFGFERSMHMILPEIVPFDDAVAVSLHFILLLKGRLSEAVDSVPEFHNATENIECDDTAKTKVIERMKKEIRGKKTTIDGVRIEEESGWALIRQSNTEPIIRITAEGKTKADVDKLIRKYSGMVERIKED